MAKSKVTKMWLVSEVGWEYNDQYYYRTDGLHPYKLFKTEDEAKSECLKLNILRLTSDGFASYAEDWCDLSSKDLDVIKSELKRICGVDIGDQQLWELSDKIDFAKMSDYQAKELLKLFNNLSWWDYQSVEINN